MKKIFRLNLSLFYVVKEIWDNSVEKPPTRFVVAKKWRCFIIKSDIFLETLRIDPLLAYIYTINLWDFMSVFDAILVCMPSIYAGTFNFVTLFALKLS